MSERADEVRVVDEETLTAGTIILFPAADHRGWLGIIKEVLDSSDETGPYKYEVASCDPLRWGPMARDEFQVATPDDIASVHRSQRDFLRTMHDADIPR